jgi:multidrug efflux pump subunit AcrA (membrane-fusion protein)
MDRPIKKKHPLVKYRFYILGGILFLGFVIYVIAAGMGPRRIRYNKSNLQIVEVRNDKFLEYVDVEGIVQPIMTIKLNSLESGTVQRIVAEEGNMLKQGDTILILTNLELIRSIDDERDELEKQRINYEERKLEMERKSSQLKRQTLETIYRLDRLSKQYNLDLEEYRIGIKSKAQLEVAADEYNFNQKNTEMLLAELQHDSLMNNIQTELMKSDFIQKEKRFIRSRERLDNLIVRAQLSGQLSFLNVIWGERVSAGSSIGELKIIDQFRIQTRISEYYIDRITTGLPATVVYQNKKYPLRITKINPEIKDRQFAVDLVFSGEQPESIRIGKTYRIQIELEQPEDALVISKGNFFQSTGGQWIFKLNSSGDKAVKTSVSIGRQNPQQYEILNGLKPGDRVIITGYDNFGDAGEVVLN